MTKTLFSIIILLITIISTTNAQKNAIEESGRLIIKQLQSEVLKNNKIGLNTKRDVHIYLPPSYFQTKRNYPVVYYLHSIFNNPKTIIVERNIAEIIEKNIKDKLSKEFILIVADFTSPTIGSLYENSSTSGLWLDFITKELIPFVDKELRVIPNNESRAVIGDFMGGRGALKLAMMYPEIISNVYALHPVATGSGYLPRASLDVDWGKIHEAKSYDDLLGTGRTQIFASICQAFLPNPNRPPLYADFQFEEDTNGNLKLNSKNVRKEMKEFHLDEKLDEFSNNLNKLNSIAFDWGRFDPTQAHVISNRRFSKILMDLGIEHLGEEFVGDPWNKYWGEDGRFSARVIPFLNKHLKF